MYRFLKFILFFNFNFIFILCEESEPPPNVIIPKTFMFWPNATVPFFVNPDHFDHEQALVIMTALSMFAFKTCLKFAPVMSQPEDNQHIMVFENPEGLRRCKIITSGHSIHGPHPVILGYECLQSPQIDMLIMKALGFPFEHNRASRDVFIDVLIENIEPGSIELFTKESVLPVELRSLPYDVNSVMHFGERDYSKNGHRTIIFKDHNTRQNRKGLSAIDLRKIESVYGPECRQRDRQEKIELCQSYPGVARKKRDVVATELKSLRVNPDITPPPDTTNVTIKEELLSKSKENIKEELPSKSKENIKELGIEDEVQVIVEHAYKVSGLALKNARETYCKVKNSTKKSVDKNVNATDLFNVIDVIADYAKSVVDSALSNLTIFCEETDDMEKYQRAWGRHDNSERCRQNSYRSTKTGGVHHSTNHRPTYFMSTHHYGHALEFQGARRMMESDNATDITTESIRSKRDFKDETNTTADVEIKTELPPMNSGDISKLIITRDIKWDVSADVEKSNVNKDVNVTKNETVSENTTTASENIVLEITSTSGNVVSETTIQKGTQSDVSSKVKKPEIVVLITNTTVQSEAVVSETPKEQSRRKRDVNSENKPEIAVLITNTTDQNETVVPETFKERSKKERDVNSEKKSDILVLITNTTVKSETVVSETPKEQSRRKRDVNSENKSEIAVLITNTTDQNKTVVPETLKKRSKKERDVNSEKKSDILVLITNTTVKSETVVSETPKEQSRRKRDVNSENKSEIAVLITNTTDQNETVVPETLKKRSKKEKDDNSDKKPEIAVLITNTTVQNDTVVSVNPKGLSRRKRDVKPRKKPEIVVLKNNDTLEFTVEVKDSKSSKEVGVMTTKSGFMKVKLGEQRYFHGRRFRVKNPKGKNVKAEWDASTISMERSQNNSHTQPNKIQNKQRHVEERNLKHRAIENTKKKEERIEMKGLQRVQKKRRLRNMVPRTVTLTKLNAEFYNERMWPAGDVRYMLADNSLYDLGDVRRRLGEVSAMLKRKTCINLYEVTEEEANNYIDYLVIDTSPDYVTGRVGGKQNFGSVELFRGGQHRQHAAMMVMAMLGFYFEVARHDRDKYIRVHMRHVRPDKLHHFEKIREEATFDLPYDYLSAMHPAWQFWRKIGKTGISTVATYKEHDPDGTVMKRLGQNEELLSELDIVKINSVYGTECFKNSRSKKQRAEDRGNKTAEGEGNTAEDFKNILIK